MSHLSLLYVDDDADIRTIVGMSLSLDPALTVRIAGSGAEGLGLLAAGPVPDAVILDVMMPGMDGPTVMERMRADPRLGDVPVIFMTARARDADVAGYMARGAAGVILKPFDPVHLAARVRAILAGGGPDAAAH